MSERNSVVVIFVTAPDEKVAESIARTLVQERLVACANIVPGLRSHYWWDGEVQEASELLMLLKARKSDVQAVAKRVQELHPYEVPEVVALDILGGLPAYVEWIRAETDRC
jgi:periplasmic divalent cation tolerance protein